MIQLCLTTYHFPSFTHTTETTHFLDCVSSFNANRGIPLDKQFDCILTTLVVFSLRMVV